MKATRYIRVSQSVLPLSAPSYEWTCHNVREISYTRNTKASMTTDAGLKEAKQSLRKEIKQRLRCLEHDDISIQCLLLIVSRARSEAYSC